MQINKKTIAITSAIILTIAAITSYQLLSKNSSGDEQIVASYEGGNITLTQAQMELNKMILKNPDLQGLTFGDLNVTQKEMVIKEVVLKEIAYQEAKKQRLNKSDDYKQALKLFESEMLQQKLFLKIATDAKEEENLKKNYDELVAGLEDKKDIRISYIALKTENEANNISKILAKYPKSFARQAKLKSIDTEIAKKGGDLGFVLEDLLPSEITKTVKNLQKGQISNPISLGNRWVIIKLEDSRPAKISKFEDVKENLAQNLSAKALQDFITKSIKDAKINIVVN